jgi:predicted SAM-dependent methyltransferase
MLKGLVASLSSVALRTTRRSRCDIAEIWPAFCAWGCGPFGCFYEDNTVPRSPKKILGTLLLNVWPRDLLIQLRFETIASVIHFRSWLFARSKYRGRKNLKLNIGCGKQVAEGWVNIDLGGPPEVFRWDCRRGMPFDDGSVTEIFAEHVFEHFDPSTASLFLAECHRCLQADGIARIVVPDAGKYVQLYQGDWSGLVPLRPLIKEEGHYRDYWLERTYRTKMELINEIFRQGVEHKYAYDADTLILRMREAGFERVLQQQFGVSAASAAPLDSKHRAAESLYIEGIR